MGLAKHHSTGKSKSCAGEKKIHCKQEKGATQEIMAFHPFIDTMKDIAASLPCCKRENRVRIVGLYLDFPVTVKCWVTFKFLAKL